MKKLWSEEFAVIDFPSVNSDFAVCFQDLFHQSEISSSGINQFQQTKHFLQLFASL